MVSAVYCVQRARAFLLSDAWNRLAVQSDGSRADALVSHCALQQIDYSVHPRALHH
jgi:hypothetical protein